MAAAVFPGEPEEFRASGHQQEPACWGKPKGKPLYSWETKPHPFISPSLHSSILVHGGLCILDFLTRKVGQASVEVLTHMEKNKENRFWLFCIILTCVSYDTIKRTEWKFSQNIARGKVKVLQDIVVAKLLLQQKYLLAFWRQLETVQLVLCEKQVYSNKYRRK